MKHNSWISHNLDKRIKNRMLDFKFKFKFQQFKPMKFHDAAGSVASQISKEYKNIFLSFSGGADSEYVFKCFVNNKIQFTPVIVVSELNEWETNNARTICKEYNIVPVIIKTDRYKILKIYVNQIVQKLNGIGFDTTANLITAQYVKSHDGVLILGNQFIGEDIKENKNTIYAHEWDFYNDVLCPDVKTINFFHYNIEIFYAMLNDAQKIQFNTNKCDLYGIRNRPKVMYHRRLKSDYLKILEKIENRALPKNICHHGTLASVLKKLEEVNGV